MRASVCSLAFLIAGFVAGCAVTDQNGTDAGSGSDGGPENCGAAPFAAKRCTDPSCTATSGTKSVGLADLDSVAAADWAVVSWAASEVAPASQNTEISYSKTAPGGLRSSEPEHSVADPISAAVRAIIEDPRHLAQIDGEHLVRSFASAAPIDRDARGTAIAARPDPRLPPGVKRAGIACNASSASSCGASALCRIPEGANDGTCESALTIKFYTGNPPAVEVPATVKKVGTYGAIVVDDADTVAQGDIDTLLMRFDEHIAPLDHQFFGEPKKDGKDRDGNGVVIIFLTSKVGQPPFNSSMVGFFSSEDLKTSAASANSNAADILYMQPPGVAIKLDDLSGTIGHEYQHLINYYAKVLVGGSDQEERWLDEGIASFAEDMLGYGGDALKNVLAYLSKAGSTSLTGFGLLHTTESDADSAERRGMAQLMVRYVFEQAGGASFDGPGMASSHGGVEAIHKLVQSADTGISNLVAAAGGSRSFDLLLGDLLTTMAIDGTTRGDLKCLTKYNFLPTEHDAYTGFQRGVDLRTTVQLPNGGASLPFTGPSSETFAAESAVPLPVNGGEFRTLNVGGGKVTVGVSGPFDIKFGWVAIPR